MKQITSLSLLSTELENGMATESVETLLSVFFFFHGQLRRSIVYQFKLGRDH